MNDDEKDDLSNDKDRNDLPISGWPLYIVVAVSLIFCYMTVIFGGAIGVYHFFVDNFF